MSLTQLQHERLKELENFFKERLQEQLSSDDITTVAKIILFKEESMSFNQRAENLITACFIEHGTDPENQIGRIVSEYKTKLEEDIPFKAKRVQFNHKTELPAGKLFKSRLGNFYLLEKGEDDEL